MGSITSAAKNVLLWVYWHPFRSLVRRMPARWVYALADVMGSALCRLSSGRRRAIEEEYSRFTGNGDSAEDTANAVRDAFVVNAVRDMEVLLYPALNSGNIAGFVECEGLEHLDGALGRGRGAMLVFAHFGSNQMIMPAIGYRGYRMSQLSAPPTVWEEKLPGKRGAMWKRGLEIRWTQEQSLPVTHINVFGSMKEVFLCLKRNEVLGIAMDGGGGRTRVAAEFLGRRAFFSTGAMEIAERTRCAVLPAFIIREAGGRHRLVIEPPMEGEPGEGFVERQTAAFVKRLDMHVRRHPGHYLGFLAFRRFMEANGDAPFFEPRGGGSAEEQKI